MARPTTFTEEIAQEIYARLEKAMPLSLAAEAAGVPRETAFGWEKHNEAFAHGIARARARGAEKLSDIVLEGGKGSAMAGWMLERRYRDDYAPPRKEEVQPSEVRITIEGGLPARPKAESAEQNAVAPPPGENAATSKEENGAE